MLEKGPIFFTKDRAYQCSGRSIVELGSGTGLVGLSLAAVGVKLLVLSDGHEQALANCAHNLMINGVDCSLHDSPADVDYESLQVFVNCSDMLHL